MTKNIGFLKIFIHIQVKEISLKNFIKNMNCLVDNLKCMQRDRRDTQRIFELKSFLMNDLNFQKW